MLSWIIQIFLISIIFIFLIHNILLYFKSTLTVPKIKDLVNTSNQKYQNIYDVINNTNKDYSYIDLLPSDDISIDKEKSNDKMKNELKSFLKKQLNSSNDSSRNAYDMMPDIESSNYFSKY